MSQTFSSIHCYPGMDSAMLDSAIDSAAGMVRESLGKFTHRFKSSNSFGGFFEPTENVEWTTGFWTGCIWLAYEHTGDPALKAAALSQVDSFLERIQKKIDVNHHDMGFLYSLSCVAAYKLTGSETGKEAALLAADHLAERFRTVGNFLQAWGNPGDPKEYRLIIDCLLNLPILYWASEVTGNPSYAGKAKAHIQTAMKCLVRPDHSTYHTHFFDVETGEPTYGVTHQGNRNGSAWARGQAWGVYGTAVGYRYTKRPEYIEYFKRVTRYFLEHLPSDLCPYWDLTFGEGDEEPRDSSSAAIAACGMLEMSKYMEPEDAAYYTSIARKLIKAMVDHYRVTDPAQSNGQLLHGTYSKKTPYNTCTPEGVDECVIWGDYFYMEALHRVLMPDWNIYW